MAKKNKGPGIQAAAGLIRYFDEEEDQAPKIPPTAIMVASAVVAVAVLVIHTMFKLKGA